MATRTPFSTTRHTYGTPGTGAISYPARNGSYSLPPGSGIGVPGGAYSFDTNLIGQVALVGVKQAVRTLNVRIGRYKHESLLYLDPLALIFTNKTVTTTSHNVRGFVQAISLGGLNHLMRSKPGRDTFGRMFRGSKVAAEWIFWGLQQTDTTIDSYKGRDSFAMNTIVGLEGLTPNIWLATGNKVGVNDHLWLLLRRRRFVPASDEMFHRVRRGSSMANAAAMAPEEEKEEQFYWRYEPYKTPGTERPPAHLLEGDGWVGHAIYIGVVCKLYRPQNDPKKWMGMAQEVCFPETIDETWSEKHQALPRVTIQLGIK